MLINVSCGRLRDREDAFLRERWERNMCPADFNQTKKRIQRRKRDLGTFTVTSVWCFKSAWTCKNRKCHRNRVSLQVCEPCSGSKTENLIWESRRAEDAPSVQLRRLGCKEEAFQQSSSDCCVSAPTPAGACDDRPSLTAVRCSGGSHYKAWLIKGSEGN